MHLVRALAALAVLSAAPSLHAQVSEAQAQARSVGILPGETLLEVATMGIDRRRPDTLTLEARIEAPADTPAAALEALSTVGARLTARMRQLGVRPDDLQTQRINVYPQWDTEAAERAGRRPRILGYVGESGLEVRVRDLNLGPRIFEALIEAGADRVSGPNFSLSDPAEALRAARGEAIRLARAEADAYAEALGMRVVRVIRVSERDYGSERLIPFFGGFVTAGAGERTARLRFEPGEKETSRQVWVDFALAPR